MGLLMHTSCVKLHHKGGVLSVDRTITGTHLNRQQKHLHLNAIE